MKVRLATSCACTCMHSVFVGGPSLVLLCQVPLPGSGVSGESCWSAGCHIGSKGESAFTQALLVLPSSPPTALLVLPSPPPTALLVLNPSPTALLVLLSLSAPPMALFVLVTPPAARSHRPSGFSPSCSASLISLMPTGAAWRSYGTLSRFWRLRPTPASRLRRAESLGKVRSCYA